MLAAMAAVSLAAACDSAHAEGLNLNSVQAEACPDCVSDDGGARVVNLYENLAGETGAAPTYSGPSANFDYPADAQRMFSDYSSLNIEGTSIAGGGSTAPANVTSTLDVAGGVEASAEGAGVLPVVLSTSIGDLPVAVVASSGAAAFAAGFAIGTAGRYLVGKLFAGTTDASTSGYGWTQEVWRKTAANTTGVWSPGACPPGKGSCWHLSAYNTGNFQTWNFFKQPWDQYWPQPNLSGPYTVDGCGSSPNCVWSTSSSSTANLIAYKRDLLRAGLTPAATVPAGYHQLPPVSTVPSRTSIASSVSTYLNSQSDTSLARWLEYELAPSRCNADPTSQVVIVPWVEQGETLSHFEDCLQHLGLVTTEVTLPETNLDAEDGQPTASSPGQNAGVAPGTEVKVYVNPPPQSAKPKRDERCRPSDSTPAGDPGATPPGFTGTGDPRFQPRPAPALSGYPGYDWLIQEPREIKLWWGDLDWGYRHIMVRRGYGVGDEHDTILALQDPAPVPEDPPTTSWFFHMWYDVTDPDGATVHCVRTVLVNFFHRENFDPAPEDIITSYYGSVP